MNIQTEASPVPSVPAWFGEVALVAHTMTRLDLLSNISERVRFTHKRFGTSEVIDFLVVLIGYAREPTLAAYYECLSPFATEFMALFGRSELPHRSSLSRFLSALDEASVEALRTVFLQDALARPGSAEGVGGMFDRQGNRWIVFDLDGTRQAARQRALPQGGKDYGLLDLPEVKVRLALPADEQFTHPESGLSRDLFDCGQLPLTAQGHRSRLIVATHLASTSPVGVMRDGMVYELFFTALPALGFMAADVVRLYLHRGSFETELADEDREQDSDRWCSLTQHGQEIWQILSQWMWNLRQELSQHWQPTQMRLTVFAEAQTAAEPPSTHLASQPASEPPGGESSFGLPQWARPARVGSLGGEPFVFQPHGTLRCPQGAPLYQQERRPEHDGTLRVLYSARIADCRACSRRTQCQGHGASPKKPRRVSAVLHPLPQPTHEDRAEPPSLHEDYPPPCSSAPHPLLWGDWPRCQPRRSWIQWLRRHLVTVNAPPVLPAPSTPSPLSHAERAHWRLKWLQRFARNARLMTALPVEIMVYGVPTRFAHLLGLRVA